MIGLGFFRFCWGSPPGCWLRRTDGFEPAAVWILRKVSYLRSCSSLSVSLGLRVFLKSARLVFSLWGLCGINAFCRQWMSTTAGRSAHQEESAGEISLFCFRRLIRAPLILSTARAAFPFEWMDYHHIRAIVYIHTSIVYIQNKRAMPWCSCVLPSLLPTGLKWLFRFNLGG